MLEQSSYRHAVLDALSYCQIHLGERHGEKYLQNIRYLDFYRPVAPVIQSGPLCGLVALSMAAPLTGTEGVTTEFLLDMAREKGYTLQGEMFSADAMCELAKSVLVPPYSANVMHQAGSMDVLQRLLNDEILLVPYDADKNHSPCLRKGNKAHWVLVTGFLLAVETGEQDSETFAQLEDYAEYYEPRMFHLKLSALNEVIRDRLNKISCVFVCGHQGKSKYAGTWPLKDLLESNNNLVEIGPERSGDEYIVPEGGIKEGLCGKIVRIFRTGPPPTYTG